MKRKRHGILRKRVALERKRTRNITEEGRLGEKVDTEYYGRGSL